MQFFTEYQQIFSSLKKDTLILTPNQRLSRFILTQYGLWCEKENKNAWATLHCSSLNVWINHLWSFSQILGLGDKGDFEILTSAQERVLWLQAIECGVTVELLVADSMADLTMQAWRFLRLWKKTLVELPDDTQEVVLFKQWVNAFQVLKHTKKLLDATDVIVEVEKCIVSSGLSLPQNIVCIGFDELTPTDKSIFETLTLKGVNIQYKDIVLEGESCRIELADTETEITYMARWAASLVESNNKCSIGIVIPDLANIRPVVERIFTSVFEPQYIFPDKSRHAPAFNVSAAQPLAQTPLIATALIALQLNKKSIERDVLSSLLMSPFIGVSGEFYVNIKILRDLQKKYIHIPISALRSTASRYHSEHFQLHHRLLQFEEIVKPHQYALMKCSEWAKIFDAQLLALGWPGERTLDTLEFQQLTHWPELIAGLGLLDKVLPEVDLSRAISELSKLAYIPFHAQTAESPVQILGVLEAAGQQFDHIWVMGLDYRTWPEACKPNPLIPVTLQKKWGMPRSSMEKELALAKQLTERLKVSAHNIIFSSPKAEGDQPLRPSSLITVFPLIEKTEIEQFWSENYIELMSGADLIADVDDRAPPVSDIHHIRGGTQILKNQAACAFRAFAKNRIYAVVPEKLQLGISAITRGNLIHSALELIWGQLESQEKLLRLSVEEIDHLIEQSIAKSWLSLIDSDKIGLRMKAVETQRSKKLICQWLELEKQRAPFRVKYHEKSIAFTVANLPLTIRYDRMDELVDDGGLVVLDYKTGSVNIRSWAGIRPDDPQVPLYCLSLADKPIAAAVLAQLNVSEVTAKGISANAEIIPGLKTPEELTQLDLPNEWSEIQTFWRYNLEQLAHAFLQGDAQVDPKSVVGTCSYCDLKSLCRIGINDTGAE